MDHFKAHWSIIFLVYVALFFSHHRGAVTIFSIQCYITGFPTAIYQVFQLLSFCSINVSHYTVSQRLNNSYWYLKLSAVITQVHNLDRTRASGLCNRTEEEMWAVLGINTINNTCLFKFDMVGFSLCLVEPEPRNSSNY